ncbi:DNA polymerase III subunit gamma/tau [Picosynechococcus sp. PCC 11901]|uniref:DNA polymerase III subunit gamma/tau n=1 Tax=Picosynechococcus sp. PCC 11901 TaxID=2579791 RepID=UPI0010FBEF18|nr:DNA polymerase III subunit gamma/tau [Picosynechococcus sp. PCC 11901]QCS50242.1 DNA polymerase III subunit gamma/tau [Picosynechococcus sp. PCC 11901]
MAYEPLHHKYRPQTFAQLVGQEAIATTLSNALEQRRIAPAYLFSGPRGTGKTSSARILAKSLNCLNAAQPTPHPCGECEVCRAIANGSALDVIEIDAASNTGVDNIRELIERSQFAPVQCRYKVYVIDECLTGDTLVTTRKGLMRLDDPNLKGQDVLSFSETTGNWEYKKVLRWLDQGQKRTLTIKTANRKIRCTDNHLIRTEQGWVQAKNVVAGMKILSPVNAVAAHRSTNMELMVESVGSSEDINLRAINTAQNHTSYLQSWHKQKKSNPNVNVAVVNSWIFPHFSSKKAKESKVFSTTGNNIPLNGDMVCGRTEQPISSPNSNTSLQNNWDWSTVHYSVTAASITPIAIVDFHDYAGPMVIAKQNGLNINSLAFQSFNQVANERLMLAMDSGQLQPEPSAIPNSVKSKKSLNQTTHRKLSQQIGYKELTQKEEHGGTWTMALSQSTLLEAQVSNFTQKGFLPQKINKLPNGLLTWDIPQNLSITPVNKPKKSTTTSNWERKPRENGFATTDNFQSPQWTTNFETVEAVTWGEIESVYDIEVEENHNFVANGLLVHNCHMLSVAAFNALLKTLEEPPAHVVFVLATTDPQRVLPTIISRCQRFDYRRIPLDAMVAHLRKIAHLENIDIPLESVTLIAQIANGGLRDAESLLDQLSLLSGEITPDKVWDLVGAVPERDLLQLLQVIHSNDPEAVIQQCRSLLNRGREPLVVLQNLASFYLNLLIAKTAPQRGDLIAVTQPTWEILCQEANQWELSTILQGQQHLKESEYQLKNTTQPRLWLEITLLGLLPAAFGQTQTTRTATTPLNTQINLQTQPTATPPTSPAPPQDIPHPFGETPPATNGHGSGTPPSPVDTQVHQVPPKPEVPQVPAPVPEAKAIAKAPPPQDVIPPTVQSTEPPPLSPSPPATTSPTISALEREELWQGIVRQLPLLSQSLFRDHGKLLQLTEHTALIGIKSANLLKIAKNKTLQLEAAFEKICGNPLKVTLQVGHGLENGQGGISVTPILSTPAPAPTVISPAQNPVEMPPPPVTETPQPMAPPPLGSPTKSAPDPKPPEPTPTAHRTADLGETAPPAPAVPPLVESASSPEPTAAAEIPETTDDIQAIAQQFAELFDGEVIELTHFVPPEETDVQVVLPSEPEKSPPSVPEPPTTPVVQGRPPVPVAPDDEIPF